MLHNFFLRCATFGTHGLIGGIHSRLKTSRKLWIYIFKRESKLHLLRLFLLSFSEKKHMKLTPFAPLLTRSLALITCLLALHCLLCSRAHSFTSSLAQELMHAWEKDLCPWIECVILWVLSKHKSSHCKFNLHIQSDMKRISRCAHASL